MILVDWHISEEIRPVKATIDYRYAVNHSTKIYWNFLPCRIDTATRLATPDKGTMLSV